MNLDKRQKVLLGVFAGVILLWQGSGVVWGVLFSPFNTRNVQIAALDGKLKEKEDLKFELDLTERRTRIWERRSLPPNPAVASTLYHFWVIDLANSHKLEKLVVTPERVSTGLANPVFSRIPVSVTAECKMDQLCRFLYDFYRTDLLHKITHLAVESQDAKPNPTLKVNLKLEGLALASAKSRTKSLFFDKQEKSVAEAMSKKSLAEYQPLIAQNRFVRGYNGPQKIATSAPPATPFDSAPFTKLVAAINDGQDPEAWLYDASTDKHTVLSPGKEFEISGVKGQVLEIGARVVKLKINDKKWRLELGENLKQMVELKDDQPPPATGITKPGADPQAGTTLPAAASAAVAPPQS